MRSPPNRSPKSRSRAAEIGVLRDLWTELAIRITALWARYLIEARLNDKGATVRRSKRMLHFSI